MKKMNDLKHEDLKSTDISDVESNSSPNQLKKSERSGLQTTIGLFFLPEEVQELILCQLDVKDLVSCAKVCRLWRSGINSSCRIWKKLCLMESYKPELLDQCPTHLFVHNGEDNASMGLWRKVYGWHEQLKSNWRKKVFNRFKLAQSDSHVYCFDTNGDLAVTGHEDSSVTVWSIKTVPFVVGNLKGVLHEFPILSVRVEKNVVIILQRKLLQVFYYINDKYELTDLKCFEMGEDNTDQIENYSKHTSQFSSWYEECLRAFDKTVAPSYLVFNVFGNLLFASSHHSGSVRIWTLPRSEICIRLETLPEVSQILSDETNVYLVSRDQVTYLMMYDPETQSSIALLSVPGLKKLVVGDELVIALPSPGDVTLKRIWAYKKGDYSRPIGTRTITGYSHVALCPPHYVVYSEDTTITVWDPINNSSIAHFATGAVISYLRPSFSSFLLVFMGTALYLWDWKKEERLYRIYNGLEWTGNYGNLLWANASTILSGGVDHQLEMVSFM